MNALDMLFDGLEKEMRPTHDFYFHTASFDDPIKSGGQREWKYLMQSMGRDEWSQNRVLDGMRRAYAPKIYALMHPDLEKAQCPYGKEERMRILQERRMIVRDCMDCLRTVKGIVSTMSDISEGNYQQHQPIGIVDFSDEHIPSIKSYEDQMYQHGLGGTTLAEMFRKMKIRRKLYDKYDRPCPLHYRVAVHPGKFRQVYGYMFTDSTRGGAGSRQTYEPFHGKFTEVRHIMKTITMAVRPDMTQMVVPELLQDALNHMQSLNCDRFEDMTNEYHRDR